MAKRKADDFIISDNNEDLEFQKSETEQSADSEEEKKSRSRKKSKAAAKDSSNGNDVEGPSSEKSKSMKKPKTTSDSPNSDGIVIHSTSEGDKYLDLGKKKRATVRTFKGNTLLDIREFYGPEGDEKPGKKGISLTIEQWEALKHSTTAIDSLFAKLKKSK